MGRSRWLWAAVQATVVAAGAAAEQRERAPVASPEPEPVACCQEPAPAVAPVRRRAVATIPVSERTWGVRWAPDASQVAWIAASGRRDRLVVNGVAGPDVDRVHDRFLLGANGRRVAYAAQIGTHWHPVIDHEVGEAYDAIQPPVSDARGFARHIAFAVRLAEAWYVRIDDDLHGPYGTVRELRFSADGNHVAWIARSAGVDRVIVNGQPVAGGAAARCGALAIHPTEPLVSYLRDAAREARCVVGADTVLWPRDAIACGLGPGAARLYVVARPDGRQHCWWNRERGPIHDIVLATVIAPTADRWAALGLDGTRTVVTLDGRRHVVGDAPTLPVFSPDGRHAVWRAQLDGDPILVLDGVASPAWPGCSDAVGFSSDGRQVVLGVQRGAVCWREVLDVAGWPHAPLQDQGDNPR